MVSVEDVAVRERSKVFELSAGLADLIGGYPW